jgi:putative ABC transport system permease protein
VVGIVPEGGLSRVYLPRRSAQLLFGSGSITRSTVIFVKLDPSADVNRSAMRLRSLRQEALPVRQYRDMLQGKWGMMYKYVDMVNAIALANAFMFIMVTLYIMVLQRTREIAILKSFGASRGYVLRLVLAESLVLTAAGTAMGMGLSFVAAWAIGKFTLYTVTITAAWLGIAVAAAFVGAVVSGLYPAWRATRVDMVQALTLE